MVEDWIKQRVDTNVRYTGSKEEIHICCPVCNDTRYRFYINLLTGQVYCHNCQFKGTVVNLIQYIENVPYTVARERFDEIKGDILLPELIETDLEKRLGLRMVAPLQKRAVPLPEEFQSIAASQNVVAQRAERYLLKRGISHRQIEQHKIGICARGQYANRIIIPIHQEGELKFWVARALNTQSTLKERSPSNLFYQYGKSEVIFNLDIAARCYHSAVISEGIFDALSWGDIGISLLGKVLYDTQLNLLLQYRDQLSEGVYIALDADARADAMKIAQKLAPFFPVKIIYIPPEYDDPNQYLVTHSKGDMWKLITCAGEYGEFTSLHAKLLNLTRVHKSRPNN